MTRARLTSKRPVAMSTARPPVQRPATVPPMAIAPMPMPSGSLTSIPVAARSYDMQPARSLARPPAKPPTRRRP